MTTGASALAGLPELGQRWRVLEGDDAARAELLLGDASRMILREYPTVLERLSDTDFAADVAMVTCNVVRRAMIAEGRIGVEEENETRGRFVKGRRYANTAAELDLTERERTLLEGGATVEVARPVYTGPMAPTTDTGYVMPHWPRDSRRTW